MNPTPRELAAVLDQLARAVDALDPEELLKDAQGGAKKAEELVSKLVHHEAEFRPPSAAALEKARAIEALARDLSRDVARLVEAVESLAGQFDDLAFARREAGWILHAAEVEGVTRPPRPLPAALPPLPPPSPPAPPAPVPPPAPKPSAPPRSRRRTLGKLQ